MQGRITGKKADPPAGLRPGANRGFMRLLKRHRLSKGMTLKELASKLKVSITTVYQWESGQSLPLPRNVPRLARVLELEPMELTKVLDPEPLPAAASVVAAQ